MGLTVDSLVRFFLFCFFLIPGNYLTYEKNQAMKQTGMKQLAG